MASALTKANVNSHTARTSYEKTRKLIQNTRPNSAIYSSLKAIASMVTDVTLFTTSNSKGKHKSRLTCSLCHSKANPPPGCYKLYNNDFYNDIF